jgi:hypothetical protein
VYFLELQSTINLYIELDAQLGQPNLSICRFANPATGQRSNQLNYVPTLFSSGLLETSVFAVFPRFPRFPLLPPFPPRITNFGR